MALRSERKLKSKVAQSTVEFVLPESLPCSEIEFPKLIEQVSRGKAKWDEAVNDSNKFYEEIEEFENKRNPKQETCHSESVCDYMQDNVFIYLIPALKDTLDEAKKWDVLEVQKSLFNGVDHIAQVLWTNNPRYPARKLEKVHIFNIPWVRRELRKNPRPHYPKSWLWTEEYAATIIQKTVRRYFAQRPDDVQEMREFWKKLEMEKSMPEIIVNPFLAKKFANRNN